MVDLGQNVGSEQNGVRPCVVLNKPAKKERTCVVIPASNTKRRYAYGLNNYIFLIHQVRVIDTTRFIRKINRFSQDNTNKIYEKVCLFLQ